MSSQSTPTITVRHKRFQHEDVRADGELREQLTAAWLRFALPSIWR